MIHIESILTFPPYPLCVVHSHLSLGVGRRNPEAKQVMFSDGIRPGGDLTELDGSATRSLPPSQRRHRPRRPRNGMDALSKIGR